MSILLCRVYTEDPGFEKFPRWQQGHLTKTAFRVSRPGHYMLTKGFGLRDLGVKVEGCRLSAELRV